MNASQSTDKKKEAKINRPVINSLYQECLGYIPLRMKPVHFATSFLLCLHRRYRSLELLNKAANPKSEEKCVGDEYVAENLYPKLTQYGQSILDSAIDIDALKLLRNHLNAAYDNDGAMNPAFKPRSTFGCDYSAPSLNYVSNFSKHGNAGALVWLVLNSTTMGQQFLSLAKDISLRAEGPAAALGLPLIEQEQAEIEFKEEISKLCGEPSMAWLTTVSDLMKPQTESLLCLARNLDNHPSSYALRKLIIGVGSWLVVYQIRRMSGLAETIFFCDFAGDVRPQLRTQAMACYVRQQGLFGKGLRLWLDSDAQRMDKEKRSIFDNYETEISKELEDHFRDFSERIGWVQPRGTQKKYFRAVPDTLSVLLLSILAQDEVCTMDDVAYRLRKHWHFVAGLLPKDHSVLRQHGYTPLDEDADLRVNRDAFKRLAIHLGFAWEPSDGLVLFSLTPDQLN